MFWDDLLLFQTGEKLLFCVRVRLHKNILDTNTDIDFNSEPDVIKSLLVWAMII